VRRLRTLPLAALAAAALALVLPAGGASAASVTAGLRLTGLNSFVDRASGSSYGGMLAMSVVTLVPTVAVFLISQRRIVDGVSNTGIK